MFAFFGVRASHQKYLLAGDLDDDVGTEPSTKPQSSTKAASAELLEVTSDTSRSHSRLNTPRPTTMSSHRTRQWEREQEKEAAKQLALHGEADALEALIADVDKAESSNDLSDVLFDLSCATIVLLV